MRIRAALMTMTVIATAILTTGTTAGAPARPAPQLAAAPTTAAQALVNNAIRKINTTTTSTLPPAPPVTTPSLPTPPAPAPAEGYQPGPEDPITTLDAGTQAAFACIRWRESRGDPQAQNPSSTASGLYQFLDSSWLAYGGGQFAPRAWQATPEQQGQVAVWAYQQSGLSPWGGGCG